MKLNRKLEAIAAIIISCNSLTYGGTTPIDAADADLCPQPTNADTQEYHDLCEVSSPQWEFIAGVVTDYPIVITNPAASMFHIAKAEAKTCSSASGSSVTVRSSKSVTEGSSWDVTGSITVGAEGSWLGLAKASVDIEVGGRYGQNSQTTATLGADWTLTPQTCKHAYGWGGVNYLINGKAEVPVTGFCTWRGRRAGLCAQNGLIVNTSESEDVPVEYENIDDDGDASIADVQSHEDDTDADCRGTTTCNCDTGAGGPTPTAPDWYTARSW